MAVVSERIRRADAAFAPVRDFYFGSRYGERRGDPGISDFTFGNPHEMPLEGLVSAIREPRRAAEQGLVRLQDQRGRAARLSSPSASATSSGSPSIPRTSRMTAGAFAAIMVAFRLLLDAGDEAIFLRAGLVLLRADAARRRRRAARRCR